MSNKITYLEIEAETGNDLEQVAETTVTTNINLEDYVFEHVENKGMRLRTITGSSYLLSSLAVQQLCKMAGVPYTFVTKNPPELNNQILHHWYPLMKKKDKQIRYYATEEGDVIRCILDVGTQYTNYTACINALNTLIEDDKLLVQQVIGGGFLNEALYLRLVLPSFAFQVGDDLFHGLLDVWLTDCNGLKQMVIDPGVYVTTQDVGLLCRLDGQPLYGVPSTLPDLQKSFESAVDTALLRLKEYWSSFKNKISQSQNESVPVEPVLTGYKENREISKAFVKKIDKDLQLAGQESSTPWDLLMMFLKKAAEFDTDAIDRRSAVEAFVAKQLGIAIE